MNLLLISALGVRAEEGRHVLIVAETEAEAKRLRCMFRGYPAVRVVTREEVQRGHERGCRYDLVEVSDRVWWSGPFRDEVEYLRSKP